MPRRVLLHSHHRLKKVRFPWRTEGVARALAARGDEVTVLCTADVARRGFTETIEDGVRFVEAPDLLWGRQRSGWDPWGAWQRTRWLQRERFDLVHCFDTRPAVIHPTLALLRHQPMPLVIDWCDWWGRGGLIEENRPAWYRALFGSLETYYEENFRRRADASTVIAHGLLERAVSLGVSRATIFWVPNGCAPDRVPLVEPGRHRAEFELAPDAILVGFNAADVTVGFSLALQSFDRAAATLKNLHLVITGNLPADASAMIARSPFADRIRQLGFLPAGSYTRVLTTMDIFLLPFTDRPANRGRWPGRINDYLSAGRPIITQPLGEMQRLLESERIGVLAHETPADIADAIIALSNDPNRRAELGVNARRLAEGELSWNRLGETLQAAYRCAESRFATRC